MTDKLRILGVFAHPADMVTEAGGALARHAENGDAVEVVILTHGGRIHPNIYVEESRKSEGEQQKGIADAGRDRVLAIKHAEMDRAAEILGIDKVHYLDYEDNMMTVHDEIISHVAEMMETIRPHILVAHHMGLGSGIGSPHELAGQIAVAAGTLASQRLSNLDKKGAHHILQTFFVSVGASQGFGIVNDLYIDITPVVSKKVRAMDQFVSQGYEGEYCRKTVMGHNGHWGSLAGVSFAEAYTRDRKEIHSLFPLTEHQKKKDVLTAHREYSKNTNLWTIPVEPSPTTDLMKAPA
ncbi:PIG-L family deacetylase [bacterium]|nr:PIG-L family deacetylase [bacterium]